MLRYYAGQTHNRADFLMAEFFAITVHYIDIYSDMYHIPGNQQAEKIFRTFISVVNPSVEEASEFLSKVFKYTSWAIKGSKDYDDVLTEGFKQILDHMKSLPHDQHNQYLSGQKLMHEVSLNLRDQEDRGVTAKNRNKELHKILMDILGNSPQSIDFVNSRGDNILHVFLEDKKLELNLGHEIFTLLVNANPSMLMQMNIDNISPMNIINNPNLWIQDERYELIKSFCNEKITALDPVASGDAVVLDIDIGDAAAGAAPRSLFHTLKHLITTAVAAFIVAPAAEESLSGDVDVENFD